MTFSRADNKRGAHINDHQSNIHNRWNDQIKPVAEVEEGDTIVFECRDGSDAQMPDKSESDDIMKLDSGRVHALSGPVYVKGAEAGDALEVEVLDVKPRYDYGWTAMLPGFGLIFSDPNAAVLDDPDFNGPYFKLWKFSDGVARMEGAHVEPEAALDRRALDGPGTDKD